jgi:hypothetical protein
VVFGFERVRTEQSAHGAGHPHAFFSEEWRTLSSRADDHGVWPAFQAGVASPNLELRLHGLRGKISSSSLDAGRPTSIGSISGRGRRHRPSAATLRDPNSFVDLSNPLATIRWVVRTSKVSPDSARRKGRRRYLARRRPHDGTAADFNEADVSIADVRWLKLDVDRVVSVGTWVEYPDLSKVDDVGFAGLMPGSGHGPGGDVNVGRIEVYGIPSSVSLSKNGGRGRGQAARGDVSARHGCSNV